MHIRTALSMLAIVGLIETAAAQVAPAPCYEPNLGTLLGTADDFVFPAVTLNAPFPFNGTNYTQVEVSSNGFIWLGNTGSFNSRCCSGNGAQMCTDPPSICPFWTDLVTDGTGLSGVYHNSLPGRDVITWYDTFEFYDPTVRFIIQLQLVAGGYITVWLHPLTNNVQTYHDAVCGFSPGNGAADPGSTNISAVMPLSTSATTIYEQFTGGTFDMAGRTFEFVPLTPGYLMIDRSSCVIPAAAAFSTYGQGCPAFSCQTPDFYELHGTGAFDLNGTSIELINTGPTGYVVQSCTSGCTFGGATTPWVGPQDDEVRTMNLQFSFPYPGGSTTQLDMCSNGYFYFSNMGANNASFWPDTFEFLNSGPSFRPAWSDYYAPGGGTISTSSSPTEFVARWTNVPEYPGGGSVGTMEVVFQPSGRIVVNYGSIVFATHEVLTGFSLGTGLCDPGSIDISTSMPFIGTGPFSFTTPLVLASSGSRPVLGTTMTADVNDQPASSVAGFMIMGLVQFNPGIPLAGIGMPGCSQYETQDYVAFFPPTPPTQTITVATIPNNIALSGMVVGIQIANFAPGVNPMGIAASNAGTLTVGPY